MPASRRRATSLLANMRLGDMAAAIDSSRLRREEERARDAALERRMAIGSQALQSIIGGAVGIGGAMNDAEALRQKAAAAKLQDQTEADRWAKEYALRDSQDRRAAAAAKSKALNDVLGRLEPGLAAQADAGYFDDPYKATPKFGGAYDQAPRVEVTPEVYNQQVGGKMRQQQASDEMVQTLVGLGFPEDEARQIAAGQMAGAGQRLDAKKAAAQAAEDKAAAAETKQWMSVASESDKAARAEEELRLKAELNAANVELRGAQTEAQKALAEKRRKEAAKALKSARSGGGKGGGGRGSGYGLKPAQAKDIAAMDATIESLSSIIKDSEEIDTGPVAGRRNAIAASMGVADPKVSEFRARLGTEVAERIKALSGAAVSESEMKRLMESLPSMNDSDDVFVAKATQLLNRIRLLREKTLSAYGAQPRATVSFDLENAKVRPAGSPVVAPSAEQGGTVDKAAVKARLAQMRAEGASDAELRAAYNQMMGR